MMAEHLQQRKGVVDQLRAHVSRLENDKELNLWEIQRLHDLKHTVGSDLYQTAQDLELRCQSLAAREAETRRDAAANLRKAHQLQLQLEWRASTRLPATTTNPSTTITIPYRTTSKSSWPPPASYSESLDLHSTKKGKTFAALLRLPKSLPRSLAKQVSNGSLWYRVGLFCRL